MKRKGISLIVTILLVLLISTTLATFLYLHLQSSQESIIGAMREWLWEEEKRRRIRFTIDSAICNATSGKIIIKIRNIGTVSSTEGESLVSLNDFTTGSYWDTYVRIPSLRPGDAYVIEVTPSIPINTTHIYSVSVKPPWEEEPIVADCQVVS